MRERFRGWGADLSDADFACALAAAGTDIQSRSRPSSGLLVWRLGERFHQSDASVLARAWRAFLATLGSGAVLIEIDPRSLVGLGIDPHWVRQQLSRPEVGAMVRIRGATKGSQSYSVEVEFGTDRSSRTKGRGLSPVPDDEAAVRVGTGGTPPPGDRNNKEERSSRSRRKDPEPPPSRDKKRKRDNEEKASPRFLQAQIEDCTDPNQPVQVRGALLPATSYQAWVRIGQPDREWVSLKRSFPRLPWKPKGYQLTVIFWEPRVCPEPQVKPLWLPPEGSSEPVSFSFQTPADGVVSARVTVLHANRVLQTGLLRVPIGRGKWTFELDAVPRAHLEDLSTRTRFDAALVLDDQTHLTAAVDSRAATLSLDDGPLEELTRFLKNQISQAAAEPELYEELTSPGTVELLRTLAQKGGALHEHLCLHTALADLAEVQRVHLTSAKPGSFFPIELLYSFEPPEDSAGLCPNAATALEQGECPGGCPADKRQHVCPLGFWGLSRVIERHAHERIDQKIDGDFLLRPEPVRKRSFLRLSGRSLLAASGKAAQVRTDAVAELHQALGKRGPASLVTRWEDWKARIAADGPTLLVLLPHHEQRAGEEILEIGEGQRLKSELVRNEHLRRLPDGPYPIVLLLGCDTNLARIAFDNFVTRFRDKGASVVVSTIATILGRDASPAAARLVELLDEEAREEGSTFGEVMVRLRRKLLATESPMALGLTAYGDADWVLTKER